MGSNLTNDSAATDGGEIFTTMLVEPEVLDLRLLDAEYGTESDISPLVDDSASAYRMLGTHPGQISIWAAAAKNDPGITDFALATNNGIVLVEESGPLSSNRRGSTYQPSDTIAVDWEDPNVVLSGCRNGHVRLWDTRSNGTSMRMVHPSAAAHVRRLNEHIIVVAGLMHQLSTYDLRFPAYRPLAALTTPYTTFPTYRNWTNILPSLGLDVYDSLIAVGSSDSTIQIFDHQSGEELDVGMSPGPAKCEGQPRCVRFSQGEEGFEGLNLWYAARSRIGVWIWDTRSTE